MPARFRRIDLVVACAVVVLLLAVGSTMLAVVGSVDDRAGCAVNLRLFGQASAGYVSTYGVFAPCDPYDLMPACLPSVGGGSTCRPRNTFQETRDPPHGWLLYHMGYVPFLATSNPQIDAWWQVPFGFKKACDVYGEDAVPPPAICPAQNRRNTMGFDSPEFDIYSESGLGYWYKYSAGYMNNRILRSPTTTPNGGEHTRVHPKPSDAYMDAWTNWTSPGSDENWFDGSSGVRLDRSEQYGNRFYYVQGINNDELVAPGEAAYFWDTLDYSTPGSTVADFVTANGWHTVNQYAGHCGFPRGVNPTPAVILGARHDGKANVLYCDGSVRDDNQTPRNWRDGMVIASTFADYEVAHSLGSQHHLMPTYRWIGTPADDLTGNPAPGDDVPPTVLATWPADGASISPHQAGSIKIQFSEQVWINDTNVMVNADAVIADSTGYDSHDASFTLYFDTPLAPGSYTVEVSAAVTDLVGNQLDGDGGGIAGDPYLFQFTVHENIQVPGDYPTIQEAIDAAVAGETIVVQPGTYPERIDFLGKAITVRGTDPTNPATVAATLVDLAAGGPIVTFAAGEGPDSILEGLTVSGATWDGGVLIYEASPTVRFCRIENNQGGGLECWSGSPTIEACLIRNNTAGYGAGIYSVGSVAIIRSNVFAENHASEEGAAIYSGFSQDWIINNTIVANAADGDGLGGAAILCILDGDAGIFNNIFHQNTDYDIVAFDAFPEVACNLFDVVPAEYDTPSNIAGDPQLADWPGGDYHILYSSPCLNAGSPAYGAMEGHVDLDGQARVAVGRVDIGADELAEPQTFVVDWQSSGDFATIQAAIDAAAGQREVILVMPGTYPENIDFLGKAVTVTGTDPDDPAVVAVTIIDGGAAGAVVTFANNETPNSIITGFTITNSGPGAAGIYCDGGDPVISKNVITANNGSGVYVQWGSPLITRNVISSNATNRGAGVYLYRTNWPEIVGNLIEDNHASDDGGGVYGEDATQIQLVGNTIRANSAGAQGGGIYLDLYSGYAVLANNLLVRNSAGEGGAIYTDRWAWLENNTFAYNVGQSAARTQVVWSLRNVRNCIFFNPGATVELDHPHLNPPSYCLIRAWTEGGQGNIVADPQFVDPDNGDYRLAVTSPCINSGDPGDFPGFANFDIEGNQRVVYGRIDMGCYEYAGPQGLNSSDPPADGTLSKIQNNVILLRFVEAIALPAGAALSVIPIGGTPADDVADQFTYELVETNVADDTLKVKENGAVLTNQTWYCISPAATLAVAPFSLDLCTLIGDASGNGRVNVVDYPALQEQIGLRNDSRYDLNGNGRINTVDLTIIDQHMGQRCPPKP